MRVIFGNRSLGNCRRFILRTQRNYKSVHLLVLDHPTKYKGLYFLCLFFVQRSSFQVEKEILDLMQKSLRLVDNLDYKESPKHAIYVYRASIIHHKLASLYHRSYRAKVKYLKRFFF